jgi:integrase/recombinase XerD
MNQNIIKNRVEKYDDFFQKDKWFASDLGLPADNTHSVYFLQFNKIKTEWLKLAAKKFVKLQSATRSFSTCRGYIRAFNHFDAYLQTVDDAFSSNRIRRTHIIGLMNFLSNKGLVPETRKITLINLRVFHQIMIHEGWLDWPEKPLIYLSDLPKERNITPKFISDDIIIQLKKYLPQLTQWMQNFIVILMETGRRISEVCSLRYDCLEQDGDGDFMLRVKEQKLSRIRLIPISKTCINAIRSQQEFTNQNGGSQYLFPSRLQSSKSPTVSASYINRTLKKLAKDNEIKDSNGIIFRFSSHQFRHTLGTQMINNGVPQVIVQQYLGHESPEMTSRYAQIHDATMKKAFINFQEKMVDINGKVYTNHEQINAKWLKQNIMSQSLPNGLCALPLSQKRCPHANACLTCSNFRTTKQHLPSHRAQLVETNKIIENAKQKGWERLVEMNTDVACNLKFIIDRLENDNDK